MRTIAASSHELKLPECVPHSVLAAAALGFQSPNQLTRLLLTLTLAAKGLTQPSETARASERAVIKMPTLQEQRHFPNSRGRRVTETCVFVCCSAEGGTSLNQLTKDPRH